MRVRQLYYFLKPVLSRPMQIYLRRLRGKSVLRTCGGSWPIDVAAGRQPAGWPGWPEDKEFAFVLTHDVEGKKGVERVEELARLEMEYGFRSSFNFVPEGGHDIPSTLRNWLVEHGFEVGVQDLHHDAKLYRSRQHFRESARSINRYLKEWNAVGFRSAYMLHNLEWLHDLNVLYDASTFDTDPFEPQPDGVGTIFPFWVSPETESDPAENGESRGYVELPYTLVQDLTLFTILQKKTIDIWKQKLEWIVAQKGMALLDTHPDYMAFSAGPMPTDEYPGDYYRQWLEHVRTGYAGRYWHALPAEVAAFYKAECPRAPHPGRRKYCMVSYSFYESDNRVRRYAEALAKRGYSVDALSLKRKESQPDCEVLHGVTVHRLQGRRKNETSPLQHLLRLCRFWLRSAWFLFRSPVGKGYELVHVHNPPDFMVFAAFFCKLRGSRIILDIHDIVPELYGNKFPSASASFVVEMLKLVEKASMRFADHVIVSNHLWHEKIIARSAAPEKASVFINHVDPTLFYPRPKLDGAGKFTIVFPGSLSWHQGVDLAIKAMAEIREELPEAEFHIYGAGHAKPGLVALVAELGLERRVIFHEMVPLQEVAQIMANADLGVVPKRADSFGNEAYSTKIMEFMAQGVPVIVSRTKIDNYYFNDSVVCFFEPENVKKLAEAIIRLARDAEYRETLRSNALRYANRQSWDQKKTEYLDLVESLVANSEPRAVGHGENFGPDRSRQTRFSSDGSGGDVPARNVLTAKD